MRIEQLAMEEASHSCSHALERQIWVRDATSFASGEGARKGGEGGLV